MQLSKLVDVGYKKQLYFSFVAGLFASGGSVFGKLSRSCFEITLIENVIIQYILSSSFIVLMLLSNAAVWTYFVKALQESSTSFVPTLCVAATNYIISAIVGVILFEERISALWTVGSVLILSGLAMISSDSNSQETKQDKTS